MLVHLVHVEIVTGQFDRADVELRTMEPSSSRERAPHSRLSGLLAEAQLNYSVAVGSS